jgi:hypothetical protein
MLFSSDKDIPTVAEHGQNRKKTGLFERGYNRWLQLFSLFFSYFIFQSEPSL